MSIKIIKRDGKEEFLDISKIRKNTKNATNDLEGVSQSELELDSQIKFIDGMKSSDIQAALIKTASDKIDVDVPNWTFVASRLFLFDLYHVVGKSINGKKGLEYCSLKKYIKYGQKLGKIIDSLDDGYDLDKLDKCIKPKRDMLFTYLGIKTLYDRYHIKNNDG